jgi:hypothetical protein
VIFFVADAIDVVAYTPLPSLTVSCSFDCLLATFGKSRLGRDSWLLYFSGYVVKLHTARSMQQRPLNDEYRIPINRHRDGMRARLGVGDELVDNHAAAMQVVALIVVSHGLAYSFLS